MVIRYKNAALRNTRDFTSSGYPFCILFKSGLLFGVGDNAAHIVSTITSSAPNEDE
jgi:hypothetical protein